MNVEEIIKCFSDNIDPETEKQLTANDLFQEAIIITMEMNISTIRRVNCEKL